MHWIWYISYYCSTFVSKSFSCSILFIYLKYGSEFWFFSNNLWQKILNFLTRPQIFINNSKLFVKSTFASNFHKIFEFVFQWLVHKKRWMTSRLVHVEKLKLENFVVLLARIRWYSSSCAHEAVSRVDISSTLPCLTYPTNSLHPSMSPQPIC